MNEHIQHCPFDAPSARVGSISTSWLIQRYLEKAQVDVSRLFDDCEELELRECSVTGMRFWRPSSVAGDALFYAEMSRNWPDYYKVDRWEYSFARKAIGRSRRRVLEVGCGRGYFLRSLEVRGHHCVGLELNETAIAEKVTRYEIRRQALDELAIDDPCTFDFVCSFQVLEHVEDPAGFLRSCIRMLRPGGKLVLSTPNYDHPLHRMGGDPFDMPPHHLNHFTAESYCKLAERLDLQVVSIVPEVMEEPKLSVWVHEGQAAPTRIARTLLNRALRLGGLRDRRLGHTILAVLRRPSRV